jgi:hypothetical protein
MLPFVAGLSVSPNRYKNKLSPTQKAHLVYKVPYLSIIPVGFKNIYFYFLKRYFLYQYNLKIYKIIKLN